jgi:hypothetical protein
MRPTCTCGECRKCKARERARSNYQAKTPEQRRAIVEARDSEKVRAADRARYQRDREKRVAAQVAYQATPEGKAAHNRAAREWAQRNVLKRKAHEAVGNAIRDRRLTKGPCEVGVGCKGRVQAHHEDYSKPLDVRWLCTKHHRVAHAAIG